MAVSEDFSLYQKEIPGLYFDFGIGLRVLPKLARHPTTHPASMQMRGH
jgi:hypothetical protein